MKKNYFVLGFLICLNFGYSQELVYDYIYENDVWKDQNSPSPLSGDKNVLVKNGTYSIRGNTKVKNLTVESDATITIPPNNSLEVAETFNTSGLFTLGSNSQRYSSLIVHGTATGTVKYNRWVNKGFTPGVKNNNDLISAPVTGGTFKDFATASTNIIQNNGGTHLFFGPFDKTTGTYVTWNKNDETILKPGIGYKTATKNSGGLVTFSGTVNTGILTTSIVIGGPKHAEWNLVGNPYPSYISTEIFIYQNENVLDIESIAIYGHNGKDEAFESPWTIFNINDIELGLITDNIAPGQAFMVAARVPSADVTFTPDMRVHGNNDDFIAGRSTNNITKKFFKINISNANQNYYTKFYFDDKSSKGLDPGYDVSVYGKKAPSFSVFSHLIEDNKGTDMAMQAFSFADLASELTIPLGINANEGQQIVVSITDTTLPAGTEVYLEDNSNNTFTLLNTSDYTFTSTSILTGTGRFFLHTSNRALSTPSNELNGLQIYATQVNKTLYIKGLIKDNAQLNIYDVQGRLINTSQLKANTNSNQVDMSNLSTGIYVVELKSSALIRTQKVVLK